MKMKSIVAAASAAVLVMPCIVTAESPYGARIVQCSIGGSYWDESYTHPTNVLGAPALFLEPYEYTSTWGEWTFSGISGGVTTPVAAAYKEGEEMFLQLDPGDEGAGTVTIEFDHDVLDDPQNPFGLDFIVFGNSFCCMLSGESTPYVDPATCYITGSGDSEMAIVEVAQSPNGPWYGSSSWRTSDGFAPTLGHRYDPDNADTRLYDGNIWWGAKSDPTFPVNPSIGYSDCDGLTLAELCLRYNGSAGGTGYDIDEAKDENGNELPKNSAGLKWFRYVRISGVELDEPNDGGDSFSSPEVDAVADVAPVSGYKNWVLNNFTWDEAWNTNLTAATTIAQNGLTNSLNCVYGLAPTDTVAAVNVPPFEVASFEPKEDYHEIKMRSPTELSATPTGLVVKAAVSLDSTWWKVIPKLAENPELQSDGTWLNTFTVPNDGAKFFKLSLDE